MAETGKSSGNPQQKPKVRGTLRFEIVEIGPNASAAPQPMEVQVEFTPTTKLPTNISGTSAGGTSVSGLRSVAPTTW
jgi:hypothetical protein